jgi:N-acetylglutamate synthase-like GNAT family acetyltransferase
MKKEYPSPHGTQKVSFPYKGKKVAYLHGLYVNPKHRGKGEGRDMMNQISADADKEDVILLLHTKEDMKPFFEKWGFDEARKTKFGSLMFRQPNRKNI